MASSGAPRSDRTLRASMTANYRWAFEDDRAAATGPARRTFLARFETAVDPLGQLDPAERARRAASLRRAHIQGLALRSAQARRARAGSERTTRT